MAYNLSKRFPSPPEYSVLLDPGAYQSNHEPPVKPNKIAFLSTKPRTSAMNNRIWTHTIYNADVPRKIFPNCTSMMSKIPRFPYKPLSDEDMARILCQCGIQTTCECPTDEMPQDDAICQAKIIRRLFKDCTPRYPLNGSQEEIEHKVQTKSPPFYDTRIIESTAFYQGCKWSRWTSKRSVTPSSLHPTPGPADYNYLDRKPIEAEICQEQFRAVKRKNSKQLRFIEEIQKRNILENKPGPGSYNPDNAKGTNISHLGPKAERFPIKKFEVQPGPADHWIQRDFDPPEIQNITCHAKLPEPSCFGIKAVRFKRRVEEGPSPASYCLLNKSCHIKHCPQAPFGSSSVRMKDTIVNDGDEEITEVDLENSETKPENICPTPTWEFKSKTIRFEPLETVRLNEPSPADLPLIKNTVPRSPQLQYMAPFYTSEGRMQPWHDWLPVFGQVKTPGPCYYKLDIPKCYPAVPRGPLIRASRFLPNPNQNPAPNTYEIRNGLETILKTHNEKLKENIKKLNELQWKAPAEPEPLTLKETELLLENKAIALLGELADLFSTKEKGHEKKSP